MRLNKKKRRKLNIREKCLLLFLILFFSIIGAKLYGLYGIYEGLEKEALELEKQIQQEKERQVLLLKDKDYYASDQYIEKIARERLGLIMPDEIIFIPKP
ncbi:MAG: hypothetical protein GX347_06995 [Epulopiscium sp.]|nr:hypothetical protein [Candidatus Epulonipiscium sp.]